jgi:serine/threonine protein kinase
MISLAVEEQWRLYYIHLADHINNDDFSDQLIHSIPSDLSSLKDALLLMRTGLIPHPSFPKFEFYESNTSFLRRYLAAQIINRESMTSQGFESMTSQGFESMSQEELRLGMGRWLTPLGSGAASFVYPVVYRNIPMIRGIGPLTESSIRGIGPLTESSIPTFMYTYGLVHTPQPLRLATNNNQAIVFVNNDTSSNQNMLFVESISGVNLSDYLTSGDIDIDVIINLLMQVVYGLEIAQHRYRFVHKDLHPENVMVSSRNEQVITYHRPGNHPRYVQTSKVAVIIDYGDSYVEIEGIPYGTYKIGAGITPQFNQYEDIFRLLAGIRYLTMYKMEDSSTLQSMVDIALQGIIDLPPFTTVGGVIKSLYENDSYFILSAPIRDDSYPFGDFVDYLETVWDCHFDTSIKTETSMSTEIINPFSQPPSPLPIDIEKYLTHRDHLIAHHLDVDIDDSRARSVMERYIIALSDTNIIAGNLKYVSSDMVSSLTERYHQGDNFIYHNRVIAKLMLQLHLDYLINVEYEDPDDSIKIDSVINRLIFPGSGFDGVIETEQRESQINRTVSDEWFRDNYHKLIDIVPYPI